MKSLFFTLVALVLLQGMAAGQFISNLDFGAGADFALPTGDITNGASMGANSTEGPIGFDIYSGTSAGTVEIGTDGLEDVFFTFNTINTFDIYGSAIIDSFRGVTHDQRQVTSGIQGNVPIGNSGTNESSTGDVAGHSVTVTFGSHLDILAEDVTTLLTSVNTPGEVFESSSLVFLDQAGVAFGSATYDGFYETPPLGAGGNANGVPGTASGTAINSNPYTIIGPGVYVAADTSTVNFDAPNTPFDPAGSNVIPSSNDFDPNAVSDAGLAAGTLVGGFTFTVLLEDVALTNVPGSNTSTSTQFTSTLNGVELVIQEGSSVPEPSTGLILGAMLGMASLVRRRR